MDMTRRVNDYICQGQVLRAFGEGKPAQVKGYIDGDLKHTVTLDLSGVGAITNVVLQAKKNWYLDNVVLRSE